MGEGSLWSTLQVLEVAIVGGERRPALEEQTPGEEARGESAEKMALREGSGWRRLAGGGRRMKVFSLEVYSASEIQWPRCRGWIWRVGSLGGAGGSKDLSDFWLEPEYRRSHLPKERRFFWGAVGR